MLYPLRYAPRATRSKVKGLRTVTGAIDERVLDLLELVPQVFRTIDGERAEAQVEGDATLLGLRVLVEGGRAGHGAQALGQRRFTTERRIFVHGRSTNKSLVLSLSLFCSVSSSLHGGYIIRPKLVLREQMEKN